jgi:hypothetical protein
MEDSSVFHIHDQRVICKPIIDRMRLRHPKGSNDEHYQISLNYLPPQPKRHIIIRQLYIIKLYLTGPGIVGSM